MDGSYIKEAARKRLKRFIAYAASITAAVCLICLAAFFSFRKISADTLEQSTQSVKDAVIRSAVQCYAVEGVYPSSLSYLEEHYGLTVNHDDYIISYEAFSENLLPEVTVLVKGEG